MWLRLSFWKMIFTFMPGTDGCIQTSLEEDCPRDVVQDMQSSRNLKAIDVMRDCIPENEGDKIAAIPILDEGIRKR
jgi:hypothetical protein